MDLSSIPEHYDTKSIPGYAISFLPATHVDDSTTSSEADPQNAQSATSTTPPFSPIPTKSSNTSKSDFVSHYTEVRSQTKPTPIPKPTSTSDDRSTYATKRKYKPAAKKVKPVGATLPEEFRIIRNITGDPLADMPILSPHTTDFAPTGRYTEDGFNIIEKNHPPGFLTSEERRLMHNFMMTHEDGFAWNEKQKGSFRKDFFPPVRMPITEHVPWALKNMPIPPGIYNDVLDVVREKIAAGVYEQSNSSYRSRWFTVLRKGGGKLRIVHDLQPLNAVTIRDSGVPPYTEQLAESCGGRACYGLLDLFVGYDERTLAMESRDLTTFQTPLGTFRLTCVPMGWSNSVPIFHGDVTYTLQDEIPDVTIPFLDDAPVKGPPTRYELPDGTYETIPENPGIRRFVWEHFQNLNRIVQRIKYVGCTWSGPKAFLCVPETLVVGHMCCYDGRKAADTKVAKIRDWGPCTTLSEVRAFLGTAGLMRIFIKNFSFIARPLTRLTRKDVEFVFGPEEIDAQEQLKTAIVNSPAIRAIDYTSDRTVFLSVDTSYIAIGFVLSQLMPDSETKRYPSRFGSMLLNEREAKYSQPKLELYGLFRSLRATRLHIIGVKNLTVEVDAKYIRGMLNNPDIQPNATINRWIAGILLFDFKLVHVPGITHGPDGLSRRPAQPEDPVEQDDDYEDWIDRAYGFMHIINPTPVYTESKLVLSLVSINTPTSAAIPSSQTMADHFPYADRAILTDIIETAPDFTPVSSANVDEVAIPRSDAQDKADHRLNTVVDLLRSPRRPTGMNDQDFKRLIRYAQEFFMKGNVVWRKNSHGFHKVVIPPNRRLGLIIQAHDFVGHRGLYPTRSHLIVRFWWPHIQADVKWFVDSCHICQTRQTQKINIPPVVAMPAPLFGKAYIDTMVMPRAGGFRYVVHARCSLSSYPEARMLRTENHETLADFIFQDIICRWGALREIVTDNGGPFVKALGPLSKRYNINHITISGYNPGANGVSERKHWDLRQVLYKIADGVENKWHTGFYSALWSERITPTRTLGYSPYFAAHGVHPILPFDIDEATYLLPPPDAVLTSEDLIVRRAQQLQRRLTDLDALREKVHQTRLAHMHRFSTQHAAKIKNFNFARGALVLIRNTKIEKSLNRKMRPRYLGPYIVISRNRGGAYILAELDGTVLAAPVGAFRVIPYYARTSIPLPPIFELIDIPRAELRRREALEDDDEDAPLDPNLADSHADE